jgi:hypothetical protein
MYIEHSDWSAKILSVFSPTIVVMYQIYVVLLWPMRFDD